MDIVRNFECWYKDVCTAECSLACVRFTEMQHLMQSSGLPKNRQMPETLTPSDEDYDAFCLLADIKDDIKTFVEQGENLFICSLNTGNGKTSWAIKLMLKYFDSIWAGNGLRTRALFVHVPTLLLQLKNFENPLDADYKRSLTDADLVIWDDVCATTVSNYDYANLLMYLDNRLLNNKANIFTSNLITKGQLEKVLGARLASRIWETSTIVELKGKDRRNGKFTDIK